ncbi:MAG: hypothetical protein WA484_14985 [Solirubrobacteraceae bacterium]
MKVQTALLARYAEVEPQGGLLNVTGGGINVFGVRRLPADVPIAFVLQLVFDEAEADIEHAVSLLVRDPQLQVVGEPVSTPFTPRLGEFHAPGWRGIFSITGGIVLPVHTAGPHSLGIQLDHAEAGDIPFQVLLAGT